ncbi:MULTISPECIES: hypothetical protein [Winogradskyella]|uniref:hypothetical protein n=1 Tax=Winogradskyella TaxID=286104 RepID=UPI0015B8DD69|nr:MULTISPECIES: hypothetical protein [Winogradskyella]
MIRNLCFFVFTLLAVYSYGQDISFEKNDNRAARVLDHSLNKSRDSLIFKSEKVISQVDIFNKYYMSSVEVNGNESKIEVANLPAGRYVVQARVDRKRIVMYLEKKTSLVKNLETADVKVRSNENPDINFENQSIEPREKLKELSISYWVVYEKNMGSGSFKTMSFKTKQEVAKMISKNKLELSTEIAKDNTLVVYEVYNTKRFMRKQLRKPTYFKSSKSRFFNVNPYYKSENLNVGTH